MNVPMMVNGPEERTLSKDGSNMQTIMSQVKNLTGLKSQLTDDGGRALDKINFNGVAPQPYIRVHKNIYSVHD